jgi:hypothetical protein
VFFTGREQAGEHSNMLRCDGGLVYVHTGTRRPLPKCIGVYKMLLYVHCIVMFCTICTYVNKIETKKFVVFTAYVRGVTQ